MSSKLTPPGISILPIKMQYPTQSGPVHSWTMLTVHTGGRACHLAHGGAYTILMGYSHLQAHIDLLVQETLNTLVYWEKKEHRIIVDAMTEDQRHAQEVEKAKESATYQQLMAMRETIAPIIASIQQALRDQGEALMAKEVAEDLPKNGHSHGIASEGIK